MFGTVRKLARLGQWNGRKRSTRQDPFFRRLGRRRVLMRVAVVWLTTCLVTGLAIWWGEPMPYRAGAVYAHDLRARVDFKIINQIAALNEDNTGSADFAFAQGTLMVRRGQPLQGQQLAMLREEHRAYLRSLDAEDYWTRGIALFLIFSLLTASVVIYVARFQTSLARNLPMIAGVCVLVLVTVVLGTLLNQPPWHAGLLPLTFTAMVLTLAYNPQFALLMSFSLLLGLTVVQGTTPYHLLEQMGGLATAILLLRNVRSRTQLVKVATFAGLAYLAMTVATGLLTGQTWSLITIDALRNCMWGALAGFVLTGLLPVVERCFGIVTDISLLELADGSHPLLQELVRRAPGTYTHSIRSEEHTPD